MLNKVIENRRQNRRQPIYQSPEIINDNPDWYLSKDKHDLLFNYHKLKNRFSNISNISDDFQKKILESYEKYKVVEEGKFSYNICDFIKKNLFFCNLDKREKERANIYDFIASFIIDKLDVVTYINNFSRFEKLLLLNFNNIQHLSFDHFKKPNMYNSQELELFDIDFNYESLKKEDDNGEKEKKKEENKHKLLKYYISKMKEAKLDEVDEKLFEILDFKLKKVIVDCVHA